MLAAMTVGMYGISTFIESRSSTFNVFSHTSISRLARTPLFLKLGVSQRTQIEQRSFTTRLPV